MGRTTKRVIMRNPIDGDVQSTGQVMSVIKSVKKTAASQRLRARRMWALCFVWFLCMLFVGWLLQRSLQSDDYEKRYCMAPWQTSKETEETLHVCITTMSDAKTESLFHKEAPRDFSNVLDATWNNRMAYAAKHNYALINASELIDVQRPPAWSKILAVQDAMTTGCDWVFWMDADALIMNSEIRLEEILPSNPDANLVITQDVNGFNAGMWLMRNSPWSIDFLREWWSMTHYIRKAGGTLSGDNDALRVILREKEDVDAHVYIPPQCAFNSYAWNPRVRMWWRYRWDKNKIITNGLFKDGDFAVHFAGIDDKMYYIQEFSQRAF